MMQFGGAAWVDQKVIGSARPPVEVFPVCEVDNPVGVPLELRGRRGLQTSTLLRMVLRGEPYIVAKFRGSHAWRSRGEALRRAAAGKVLVTSQWPALLLATDAGLKPRLHLAHNVDFQLSVNHDPMLFRVMRNPQRTRGFELKLLRAAASVVALSATDADWIAAEGIGAVSRSLAPQPVAGVQEVRGAIGFLGKVSWPPNRIALEVLLREVMPDIASNLADPPELVLAGRGSEAFRSARVSGLGAIDNLDRFYERVDLVVIPRLGQATGISVKMLEAVERGIPVVAPRQLIADAGLSHTYIAADSPAEMARAIVDYYSGKEHEKLGSTPFIPPMNLRELIDQAS
ncbi:glycosyltransferase family 4 protein [Microbacterium sp. zg-Y818]|uniref:glycosyltransferase family 4 protein n=1 Tax=unclassified Microbacterium TaxID=2609290 RepID=UPI00214B977E|nr:MULTISPECIES: glycosyltransferase family 4 protein [unclassified Microbacterium]MCR2801915.1 glycosyltransferase family 4 protein [Microbacterium sp. zg.Y818]WIM22828.1 glycosyltransferase family 4 protein [Microbacterium sp. zg-Y818]